MDQNQAVIKVIGVGGGGSNAVNRMIESGIQGVEFIAMNTDVQVLDSARAPKKIQLGANLTRGLGAGGDPEVGRAAAEESKNDIRKVLEGADMIFVTAGMGGGTGTGAAPVIADLSREIGALTVSIVTKPFRFEGPRRRKLANEGITSLMGRVDTMITIPNQKLLDVVERKTTTTDAFRVADDVLRQGVQGISDIIMIPGQINVDFADVKSVMSNAGPALMGIGYGVGEQRAIQAAQSATNSPLLEQTIHGAHGLLVNVTSSDSLTLSELEEAMDYIHSLSDDDEANIFMGTVIDPEAGEEVRITVLATGFDPASPESEVAASAPYSQPRPKPPVREEREETPPPTPRRREEGPVSGNVPTTSEEERERPGHVIDRQPMPRATPKQIWEKHSSRIREATEGNDKDVYDESELDLPAFLREHRKRKED